MKIIIVGLLVTCSIHHLAGQDSLSKKLDSMLTIYSKCNKFNGTVLVANARKVLLTKGYGFKNVQNKTLNDENTIFQIGSITKEFTAVIILKLAAQEKLSLNDHLCNYFPAFPQSDSITIKSLLSHTSGIFNYTDIVDFWKQSGIPTNENSVLDTLMKKPLLFSPGSRFSYSNSNYMLLAYIIQKVTKKPYEMVVREMILTPLDMLHTGFDFQHLSDPDKATGYWNFSAAKFVEGPVNDSSEYTGSGDMHSTVGDLYKWHLALQEGKMLDKEMMNQAYQPFTKSYGYGWELDSSFGKRTVGHNGRMFGFEAKMIRIPQDDICILLLNNDSDGPWLDAIAKRTLAILYRQSYTLPEEPLQLSVQKLKNYAALFVADGHTFEVRLIGEHLFGMEGEHAMELLPMAGNRLKFMDHEGEEGFFEVTVDGKGQAVAMSTINPRGMHVILKKVQQ